jgi:hypothetical protein
MNTTALFPRKRILRALGYKQNASRSSWSHDDGERVFFDAWTNRYVESGKYPMSTLQYYCRPDAEGNITAGGVREPIRRGHVMWLAHLDLVLAGQRQPILINPVPNQPGPRQGDRGAKGWLPRFSIGRVIKDKQGYWFITEQIRTLDLEGEVDWREMEAVRDEAEAASGAVGAGKGMRAVKALLKRHLKETEQLLATLEAL